MANLSITNKCNKKCVYCFAGDTLSEFGSTHMDVAVFDRALDYLERSRMKQVRLLGGEPTLHPSFIEFVTKSLERNFDILLFTNGLINNKVLQFLKDIPNDKLSLLLNTIHPNEKNEPGTERQKHTMKELGEKIAVGVNLFSDNQDLHYLLEYIIEFGLKKEIRLGISHSVLSENNVFLHPKDYKKIGQKIALFKLEAQEYDITFGFDCGFVPCMFPPDSIELLKEELKKAGNCCHPIVDLLTDGTFIACYPLNNNKKISLNKEVTAKENIALFEKSLEPYQTVGIYPYCSSCPLFSKQCNGGCMAFRIHRFEKVV